MTANTQGVEVLRNPSLEGKRSQIPSDSWLHNSCTNSARQRSFAPKQGISSERNLLIPNTRLWNRAIC